MNDTITIVPDGHLPLAVTIRDPALERLAVERPGDVAGAFRRPAVEVVAKYERLKQAGRI